MESAEQIQHLLGRLRGEIEPGDPDALIVEICELAGTAVPDEFEPIVAALCEASCIGHLGHLGWELASILLRRDGESWRRMVQRMCVSTPFPRELVPPVLQYIRGAVNLDSVPANDCANFSDSVRMLALLLSRMPSSAARDVTFCQAFSRSSVALLEISPEAQPEGKSAIISAIAGLCSEAHLSGMPRDPYQRSAQLAAIAILAHPLFMRLVDESTRACIRAIIKAQENLGTSAHRLLIALQAGDLRAAKEDDEVGMRVSDGQMGRYLTHVLGGAAAAQFPAVLEYAITIIGGGGGEVGDSACRLGFYCDM
jgi:hypothetical protein